MINMHEWFGIYCESVVETVSLFYWFTDQTKKIVETLQINYHYEVRLGGHDKSVKFYHSDWIWTHEWFVLFIESEVGHYNEVPFCELGP